MLKSKKWNSKILYQIKIKIFKSTKHSELFQQAKSFPKKKYLKMLFKNGEAASCSYS